MNNGKKTLIEIYTTENGKLQLSWFGIDSTQAKNILGMFFENQIRYLALKDKPKSDIVVAKGDDAKIRELRQDK